MTIKDKLIHAGYPMKHAIHSFCYILSMDGFTDGAASKPMKPEHVKCKYYDSGYSEGQKARRIFSAKTCAALKLENPSISLI